MPNSQITTKSQRLNAITKIMRTLHIYSAMPVLLLMLFFAITGVFLNHPDWEFGEVKNNQITLTLPAHFSQKTHWDEQYSRHGLTLLQWLDVEHDIRGIDLAFEWEADEQLLVINLSRPNGTTLIEVYLEDEEVLVDQRQLSTLAMLNNVHRAKHVTGLWRYLSDLSAVCMVVFCLTGLWLVVINRLERRPASEFFFAGSCLFLIVLYLMH